MNTSMLVRRVLNRGKAVYWAFCHVLAAVGLLALMFLLMQAGEGLIQPAVGEGRPEAFGQIRYDGPSAVAAEAEGLRHRVLATFLSKRYKVAQAATEQLVGVAFEVGQEVGLDPLLLLAVMAVESRFNPIAESEFGAKGLMQIIPKYHLDKLRAMGGEHTVLDPQTNVTLGARILKEYIRRTGSLESGLQWYAGALSDTSSEYAQKVIAEQERLKQAMVKRPIRPSAV
jgi:hypothetical protein